MRGDPHPGASPRAGTAGALFPRFYSPAAEPGPSSANRHSNICIKGVTILHALPLEGTLSAGPPGGPRCRYRGCSRGSGPAAGAGGSSLSPAPSSAHREGQGLGDPPLQLCHQPGDEGKARWTKGDRSQGGIACCWRRFLSALSHLSPLLGCHPSSCWAAQLTPDAATAGRTVAPALGSSGVTQCLCPAQVPPWMPAEGVPTPSQSLHRPSWEYLPTKDTRRKLPETRRGSGDTRKTELGARGMSGATG